MQFHEKNFWFIWLREFFCLDFFKFSVPPSATINNSKILIAYLFNQFFQRFQFFLLQELKFHDKVVKMFEQGVAMGFGIQVVQLLNSIKMVNVYVDKHSVHPPQDFHAGLLEILGKFDTFITRKKGFIIDLMFDPFKQCCDVISSRQVRWFLKKLIYLFHFWNFLNKKNAIKMQ